MPNRDGTGPAGKGCGTGRGLGMGSGVKGSTNTDGVPKWNKFRKGSDPIKKPGKYPGKGQKKRSRWGS